MALDPEKGSTRPLDPSRFGILAGWRRVWAVASINGQREKLLVLHEALGERFGFGDRLVYLGNCLGAGGDAAGTLDELIAFRRRTLARRGMMPEDIVFLRGTQEEMWQKLQQLHLAVDPAGVLAWMIDHGISSTIASYGNSTDEGVAAARAGVNALMRWTGKLRDAMYRRPGHHELMSNLKRACVTDDGTLLFVHAGLDPERPLEVQSDAFWWNPGGFRAMDRPYHNFRLVVRGFDPGHAGVDIGEFSVSLDGGGPAGSLVAGCFDAEGRLVDHIAV